MPAKIIGLTQGNVRDPLASSGDNLTLFGALSRHAQVVDVLDISLQGWQKYWNALRTWHPDRARWREKFDLNVWIFLQLSRLAGRLLSKHSANFDLVFQTKTLFSPGPLPASWPYTIFTDNTYALSDRYYRPWAPMGSAEKQRWLALEREAYQGARAVFARTHWLRRSLIEDYGVSPEKAVWVGNGSHFDLDTLPDRKEIDDGQTILFVGKEFERKGVPTLLKAFTLVQREIPTARLVLVGNTLQLSQPGVKVMGKISDRALLREMYRQASIFVLPANFEPCGNVITEAMAYRLPCIVSSAGGAADQVTDGVTGFVVPPRDPQVLARSMIDLLNSAPLRREMGAQAFRRVKAEFTWDLVVQRMLPYLDARE